MSSASHGGAVAGEYFCHQCNRTVTISSSPDPLCPLCNSGFVEELQNPNPNPTATSPSAADLSALFGTLSDPGRSRDEFNPFAFLENYLNTLQTRGAHVQVIIEGSGGRSGFALPTNLGDYFMGPGLEQLIQQIAENDPNRYGTPPASKSAIEALPDVKISRELLGSDDSQCAVCKDTFKLDEVAKQMPCKHVYHSDCILPWLELHNSCPVCRFELSTDDLDYESRARRNVGAMDLSGGGGDVEAREDIETPRTAERRFRVTLPWPFRGFGGEGSNSRSGDGESNNGGSI